MNKKRISLMLAGMMIVSTLALAGCGNAKTESGANASGSQTEQSSAQKQEGKKSYVIEKTSEKGDTTKVVLTYENDKVVDAAIDVITKDGSKTELSKEDKYVMKEGEEKHWHEQVAALVSFLKENNFDTTKVAVKADTKTTDAVSGVTIKVNEYVEAIDELMKEVKAGTAKEYNTKAYSLEKTSEKGDTTKVVLTYEDGKPVDAVIDVITKDGAKSELSKEGKYVMKEGEEKHWHEQVTALVSFLKENNFDTTKVAVNDDKKTDAVSGVTIKVNEYVEVIDELVKQVNDGTATEVK